MESKAPAAKRARTQSDDAHDDATAYALGYLPPLHRESELPHVSSEMKEAILQELLNSGVDDRARTDREYLRFVAAQDAIAAQEARQDALSKWRVPTERKPRVDLEAATQAVHRFVSSFAHGNSGNDTDLALMMRHALDFERFAISSDKKHLLFQDSHTEPKWSKAAWDEEFRSNRGYQFFLGTMSTSLLSMVEPLDEESTILNAVFGDTPDADELEQLKGKARQYLDGGQARRIRFFQRILPQALIDAGQVAREPPTSARATCFGNGCHAIVCGLSEMRVVPMSWLIYRATDCLPQSVSYSDWMQPSIAQLEAMEPYTTLQRLLAEWFFDEEVREYVLKSLASILFGRHAISHTKVIFFHIGSADCGKSLFMELVSRAFGEYATLTGSEYFKKQGASELAAHALKAVVSGRRLARFDELEAERQLNLGLLKKVFTSGVSTTGRIGHTSTQVTYESGCAPWICANYAQLPEKPEPDTLKKIALIGEFAKDGRRLLGTFVQLNEANPSQGLYPKDRTLKARIFDDQFSGPLIRLLYDMLREDPEFNAEDMPHSLTELREAWPRQGAAAPVISLQEAMRVALSELLDLDDREDIDKPKTAACAVAGIDPSHDVERLALYNQLKEHAPDLWRKLGGSEQLAKTAKYPGGQKVHAEVVKALDNLFKKEFTDNAHNQLRHLDAPSMKASPGVIVRGLKFKEAASSIAAAEQLVGLKRSREGDGEGEGEGEGESGEEGDVNGGSSADTTSSNRVTCNESGNGDRVDGGAVDECECELAKGNGASAGRPPVLKWKPFGPGDSRYCERYLTAALEHELLQWCRNEVRFQIYQCTSQQRVKGGEPRLKAPKAEFYLMCDGKRPHYKWTQLNAFDHAGEPMPPILKSLCEQLNADLGLTGDDRFNHSLIICNEQSGDGPDAHCAPPHADKIQRGFFADISLGYPRTMKLVDVQSTAEVASQPLASGSLAFITADDNGRLVQGCKRAKGDPKVQGTRYLHEVPKDPRQPADQPRFSIVFRPITDHPKGQRCGEHHAAIDEAAAARVRPGGDLWREYVPLCRGGSGAAPAATVAE